MSLEEKGNEQFDAESVLDEIQGGPEKEDAPDTEGHSPEEVDPDAPLDLSDEEEAFLPEDEDVSGASGEKQNSPAPEPKAPEVDVAALQQEIATLEKRLHDTQSAMHKATGEKAELQKELDSLKKKQTDEDDWFSEDDKNRVTELEEALEKADKDLAAQDEQVKGLAHQKAVAEWDAAAAPVIKEHPDFEHIMYEKLVPLLDPQTGNPQVRAAWEALEDKSPASQYAFAKKMLDVLEFQQDPEAYKKKLRRSFNEEPSDFEDEEEEPITGKEGLDLLQSASGPAANKRGSGDFLDAVFGPEG